MDSYPASERSPEFHFPQSRRRSMRPTARAWVRHSALLFLTICTTTFGWIAFSNVVVPAIPEPSSWLGYFWFVPWYYVASVRDYFLLAWTHPALIGQGLLFSVSLLTILTSHEAGHYIACRIYGVDATLPFFLPGPPLLGPGTFGAFIKIVSPIPSRRALFDIGVAGPLAGFVALIPVAVLGLLTAQNIPNTLATGDVVTFSDPLLIRLMAAPMHLNLDRVAINPFWFASWIGLLVTSLNLLPVGQLDGGHASMAVFGESAHRWLGRAAFLTMLTLTTLGWFLHGSPSGFLYTVILAIMLKVRHPVPPDQTPLGTKRLVVAGITLLVFALSFWPFPIVFR
jgi:membrane-associated protease RseP (regulator of RpoE activity)